MVDIVVVVDVVGMVRFCVRILLVAKFGEKGHGR